MTMRQTILGLVAIISYLLPLSFASAHEVYVLDPDTIRAAMATTSPNTFLAYFGNELRFFFWAFVSFVVVTTIFFATLFGLFERSLGPIFSYLRRFAVPLARITTGISLFSFGLAGELYGTELPFYQLFGSYGSAAAELAFLALGIFLIVGFQTRAVAVAAVAIYAYAFAVYGWYVLTYTDHLGAYLLLLILGGGAWSLDSNPHIHKLRVFDLRALTPFAFPILRILFGLGIMFASVYAKYVHSELALQVVVQYNLTAYFPFDPLFVVLGALIIEFLAGLMLVLGVAIRWTSLFLLFWLTLSLLYFQEAVWPHIILFGLGLAIFLQGYDRLSIETMWMKKYHRKPVM